MLAPMGGTPSPNLSPVGRRLPARRAGSRGRGAARHGAPLYGAPVSRPAHCRRAGLVLAVAAPPGTLTPAPPAGTCTAGACRRAGLVLAVAALPGTASLYGAPVSRPPHCRRAGPVLAVAAPPGTLAPAPPAGTGTGGARRRARCRHICQWPLKMSRFGRAIGWIARESSLGWPSWDLPSEGRRGRGPGRKGGARRRARCRRLPARRAGSRGSGPARHGSRLRRA